MTMPYKRGDDAAIARSDVKLALDDAIAATGQPIATPKHAKPANDAAPHVIRAMNAVSAELAGDGIAKTRENQQQRFKFRGIDDVLNALSRIIAENKLVIVPHVGARETTERETKSGGVLFCAVMSVEYTFISAEDGSRETVGPFVGEAMDSGDKATNKAMSAAYKYMALQTFCIPTEGDNDADATTHEVVVTAGARLPPAARPQPTKVLNPDTGRMVNPVSASQLKKNGVWQSFMDKLQHFKDARDLDGLKAWFAADETSVKIAAWPADWRELAQDEFDQACEWIEAQP